jgi:hypothetical protein
MAVIREKGTLFHQLKADHFGPLRDFFPYVAMRLRGGAMKLPALPVEPWLQELFTKWARREIDFVVPQEGEG